MCSKVFNFKINFSINIRSQTRFHIKPIPAIPKSKTNEIQTSKLTNWVDVMGNDLDYLESQGMLVRKWLQPLEETHDFMVAALNPSAAVKRTKQLILEIRSLQEEIQIAQEKTKDTECRLEETVKYLSNLERSITKAAYVNLPSRLSTAPNLMSKNTKCKGPISSLKIPTELKEFWYPVEFSARLSTGELLSIQLFDETWVLWRDGNGRPSCVKDQCAHRACPLSLGEIKDGEIQCPYHGWQFNRQGSCTKIPSTTIFPNVHIRSLPVSELDGLIWVWPGQMAPLNEIPVEVTHPPSGFQIHSELVLEVPVEHGLLLENLLDLAHAPFTHTDTFAKDWQIPDSVKFHASRMLGGRWDPYPIDMSFEPPCMVVSTIGLAQPGKLEVGTRAVDCRRHLHQLHVCLPSSEGKCRLLYRMSLDFLGWSKYVPGIQKLWKSVADKVLSEDLRLVVGQQERLSKGANVWSNPVSYDKLGVRYRRWRNSMSNPIEKDDAERKLIVKKKMTAAQLFSLEE
jgi:chlorophyllide a oxygenase